MVPIIQSHPANTKGRDLIIGDLHGHRTVLDNLLLASSFDYSKDRLFFVGDLTDRGPENLESLDLLREPWFFPVLGNHDFNLMLVGFKGDDGKGIIPANIPGTLQTSTPQPPWDLWEFAGQAGGRWIEKLNKKGWAYLLETSKLLQSVPHIRVIGTGEDRFHTVHAGLHVQEKITIDNAATNEYVDKNFYARNPFWGTLGLITHRYEQYEETSGKELSHTYCGHTSVTTPTYFAQHLNIDTGCGKGGKLTMICHQTKETWSMSDRK